MRDSAGQSGFTLIEFLVAALLFSLLALALGSAYTSNQTAYALGQGAIDTQQNARVGLELMTRELRMAGNDPANTIASQTPATAIQSATSTSITFLGDVDHDHVLDKVTYRLSGNQLYRDISSWSGSAFPAAASGVVADRVTSLTFTYYDAAQPTNNVIAAPVPNGSLATIKRVNVSVVTSQTTVAGTARTFSTTTDVKLRNL